MDNRIRPHNGPLQRDRAMVVDFDDLRRQRGKGLRPFQAPDQTAQAARTGRQGLTEMLNERCPDGTVRAGDYYIDRSAPGLMSRLAGGRPQKPVLECCRDTQPTDVPDFSFASIR